MSINELSLKEEVWDIENEISHTIEDGCTNYERACYLEWIAMIEENRRTDFYQSLQKVNDHCRNCLLSNPKLKNPFNAYYKVWRIVRRFVERFESDGGQ